MSKVKSNYDERHGIDQVQRPLTRYKKGLIALQSILLFMKATLRKKKTLFKEAGMFTGEWTQICVG